MSPTLAALAALTIGGAVVAVAARDARSAIVGLLVVLVGAPLIVDPWPTPLAILVRIAGALLATRFLVIALRGDLSGPGTRIGWPSEILIGAAAGLVGYGSHGLAAVGPGPAEAQAAGFGLAALAIAPLISGRDVLRNGIGAVLLLVAASLVRAGLDAPPTDGEQLIGAMLTIGLGGAVAVISVAARAAGGLATLDPTPLERGRRAPAAHRLSAAEHARDAAHARDAGRSRESGRTGERP